MKHTADREDREELYERRQPRPRRHCWIPPGWNPPNGEAYDTVFFEDYGVNPFIMSDEDPLSTFAVDVDNASYTIMRRYVGDGNLPPAEAVRLEEYVNFFDQGYEAPDDEDFAFTTDAAPSPFGEGYVLLRVGIKGRELRESQRKPANLIFVIDTSGSMAREDRLELVKRALLLLLDELDEGDRVGIVEYGSVGRIVLEPTSLEERRSIERAIERLYTGGSTNAEEGLMLAYEMASRIYDRGAINRLILCSDGVANTGETQAERILDRVRYESDRGIYLSTIGFGMGNYNDVLMEKLADQGDGHYYYVDDIDEARRVFVENLTGTLQTIARDAKVQVEFDPETVLRWRLLGYENRDVADEDFRNDRVDAGEIGAGHEVTALYEIKLASDAGFSGRASRKERELSLATVRLRYERPELERRRAGQIVELKHEFTSGDIARSFDAAPSRFKLDAVVAEYAEILRESFWARGSELGDLKPFLRDLDAQLGDDEAAAEFIDLARKAARLESAAGERDERGERYERERR
jgi:Ca-activated chloride channel family protein